MLADSQLIQRILTAFLVIAQSDVERFEPKDVKMVGEKLWWIERLIKDNTTEEQCLKQLVDTMDWRKSIGIRNLTKDQFKEVIDLGLFYDDLKDREGSPLLWIRINKYDRSELREKIKSYETYLIEKMEAKTTRGGGFTFFTDITNATMANVDIDFIAHMLKIMLSYYPRGTKRIYLYDLPKQLEEIVPVVFNTLKELRSSVVFINSTTLKDAVDQSNYPDYFKSLPTVVVKA